MLRPRPPGTSKSVQLKKIEETLVEQGHQVQKLSLSHAAARNIKGETTHSFIARHVMHGTFKGVILLDEISNQVLPLLAALDITRLGGSRIVCVGDFDQLPPISNSWRGQRVRVSTRRASVVVTIVDTCQCPGGRVLDLFAAVWFGLGEPLGAGLIDVTIGGKR